MIKIKVFYIFLDIDGVLNNENYFWKCFNRHKIKGIMSMNCFPFDPKCLENLMILNQHIQKIGYEVKIILSSTWRLNDIDTAIVNARLAEYGMRIYAKTISSNSGNRGLEIKEFLNNNKHDNFLILDDEIRDIENVFDKIHIICTNFNEGLTYEKMEEALKKIKINNGGTADE